MSCSGFALLTVAALLIQLIGLSFFIFAFFPIKPALSGFSGPESFQAPWNDSVDIIRDDITLPPDQRRILYQELSNIPSSFDRLVLMVIDGLPAEFVLGKGGQPPKKDFMEAMPYMQSLLTAGLALGFHSKAAPPTVTMPRLKAMVSGAIAGFLDVAYNFNTQALQDDNLIDQLFRTGRKLVMHGDNTWLKLFPRLFDRYDGVSSFFVRDTIQVDQNVSRHLRDELTRDDWDVLILHYLGLDHVGHIGGRSSYLMCPKLKEMDEVIQMIHTGTQKEERRRTLLVIVSDHGMTEEGNHGGSSYEETDSLAIFIGPRDDEPEFAAANWKTERTIDQVDIAPTLAILFNVPIPKNNVGVLMLDTINFLTEEQQLRALELNSWQLLRLLKAQLSDLECRQLPQELNQCTDRTEKNFCCLYQSATFLHNSWKSKKKSMSNNRKDYTNAVEAYNAFLKTASEWLSRKVTDKPAGQLAFGVAAILLSCSIFLRLSFHLYKEVYSKEGQTLTKKTNNRANVLHLDEAFIIGATALHGIGMTSSSMVEEEQYIWHFLVSTHFLLLLRKSVKALPENKATGICTILVILISCRFLRGWHQGGINWTNLPDISKWLEVRGEDYVKSTQLVACLLVILLSFNALCHLKTKRKLVIAVGFSLLGPSYLVLTHVISYQETSSAPLLAQKIFFLVGILSAGSVAVIPWIMLTLKAEKCVGCGFRLLTTFPHDNIVKIPLQVIRDSLYVIGWVHVLCWCLLQLLLQQPINALPIFFLLLQIYATMIHSSNAAGPSNRQWVQVAGVYFMGMAGHYGLGNSNSLATIDVAGAFIGTSSYSTLISGILMFMITYASPMLFLISMTVQMAAADISIVNKRPTVDLLKTLLGFPCLVPLTLNSIMLASYTVILLLMRNHLFVWSVFSPKFLYVSATTVCVDVGVAIIAATGSYTYSVSAAAYRKESSRCCKCSSSSSSVMKTAS